MLDHEKIKEKMKEHDRVWNVAIEAALAVAIKERHNLEMVEEIRKLKK